MMKYLADKLPDFFSVRDYEQIDYSLEGMDGKKCLCFFDNGFSSNVIEPNKRDIKFIWDGFILFVDKSISLDDIRCGTDLHDARLIALQRTSLFGEKSNGKSVRDYIINSLESMRIPYQEMSDFKNVEGYPSKCDLWSTRDESVLIDAINCTGIGDAYYFKDASFNYEITFNVSNIPNFLYSHKGALVLKGENSTAIARLITNDLNLRDYLSKLIGEDKIHSYVEGRDLSGKSISKIEADIKRKV